METVADCFLYQHVSFPTRQREGQRDSTLDLVFSDNEFWIDEIVSLPPLGLSDHLGLCFTITLSAPEADRRPPKFQYNIGRYDDICEELEEVKWEETMKEMDTEQAWSFFHTTLTEKMMKCIPRSASRRRKKKRCWMNKQALKLQAQKHRAWRQAQTTKHPADISRARRQRHSNLSQKSCAVTLRGILQRMLRKIQKHSGDMPKVVWKQEVTSERQMEPSLHQMKRKQISWTLSLRQPSLMRTLLLYQLWNLGNLPNAYQHLSLLQMMYITNLVCFPSSKVLDRMVSIPVFYMKPQHQCVFHWPSSLPSHSRGQASLSMENKPRCSCAQEGEQVGC